ncbi:MAG: DNA polymerase/3'-5' exonuclease PolX [candidate division WWE3 bacterium]|nr:DNA polymerase/3'-5' exonuclease PolX [candidate division WWE3 bacterium]
MTSNSNLPKFDNSSVANLLSNIAAALIVLKEDKFRIRAYENAAEAIVKSSSEVKDLWEEGNLTAIPGVGKGIAGALDEYFKTGKVNDFEKVLSKMPEGMFEILGLPEIGPATAYKLAKELHIKSVEDLKEAAEAHKIAELPGFGLESEKDILKALETPVAEISHRYLFPEAEAIAYSYIDYLKTCKSVIKVDPLGSLRRRSSTVGDIDISVATDNPKEVISFFKNYNLVKEVVSSGDVKCTVVLKTREQVDLMTQKPQAYGSLLQHFTGSQAHNVALRTFAKDKGWSLSENGIKKQGTNPSTSSGQVTVEVDTEEKFYKELGMDFIVPELRENRGEIEAALSRKLPKLVELVDIKGDLHNHTNFIEGENTLEEMIIKAKSLGYNYYAYCDHAPSIENRGLDEITKIIEERRGKVDGFNAKSTNFKLFSGLEINITAKAEMAYPNELMSKLDYVIASIHTNLTASKEEQTKRLMAAIKNPYVSIIGHPTGRLINERSSYEVNWTEVFKLAATTGTIMEINAHPRRLDLPDDLVKMALSYGVKFIISSDAHNVTGQDIMHYGIDVARRGWLQASDVVNTLSYEKLGDYLKEIRKRKAHSTGSGLVFRQAQDKEVN